LGERIVRFFAVLVIGTTLVAPPLLGWALRRGGWIPDPA
jgi:hypothetical protein